MSHTSSIFLAIGIATAGVFAALWVTIFSANMMAATKGKFEVAAWFFLVLTVVFGALHLSRWKESPERADRLVTDMEVHCFKVDVPRGQQSRGSPQRVALADTPPIVLEVGDAVSHTLFGDGTVADIEPGGIVVVAFEDGSRRKLVANMAPLRKVGDG